MRLNPAVPLVLTTLATCAPVPSPPPETRFPDLQIAIVLAPENGKCVVRFADPKYKDPKVAVAYTNHAVIWSVTRNACGEKKKEKADGKALGLNHLKDKSGALAAWADRCPPLNLVPATIQTPLPFRCEIPSSKDGNWEGIYDYEIGGDSIEAVDPGLDVKKNG